MNHSSYKSEEEIIEIVEKETIVIRNHTYVSRFVIADVRNAIILGMPWNEDTNPKVD